MNILLDYFFPITAITPTPAASTAFLKQVCVVANPKDGGVTTGVITECTTISQVNDLVGTAAKAEVQELFDAGMNKVFILPMNDLDLETALDGHESDFFTVLISNADFAKADILHTDAADGVAASRKIGDITFTAVTPGTAGNSITITLTTGATAGQEWVHVSTLAINIHMSTGVSTAAQILAAFNDSVAATALVTAVVDVGDEAVAQASATVLNLQNGAAASSGSADGLQLGGFVGVTGVAESDDDFLADQAAIENRCAFHTTASNDGKNMFYAFGKMLSNSLSWKNQQYITMPLADDVETLGDAETLFDDKVSFVISDDEFGERLALFACGGKAITAPYIVRNLEVDLQSAALSYISGNQPAYTKVQAALLEDELKKVVDSYISRQLIEDGVIQILLEQENFVASGYINIAEPNAMWRIEGEIQQTL